MPISTGAGCTAFVLAMSALPPKADIAERYSHVRFGPILLQKENERADAAALEPANDLHGASATSLMTDIPMMHWLR
jgi:hypothetical protein